MMKPHHLVALLALAGGCRSSEWILPDGRVTGTWGGENMAVIATDSGAHIHFGCDFGDTDAPIRVADDGSVAVTGEFTTGAYPVGPGITHQAAFSGQVNGRTLTLTIVLDSGGTNYGTLTVTSGVEPRMYPCPICSTRQAVERLRARRATTRRASG